jgi:hypothetical protein
LRDHPRGLAVHCHAGCSRDDVLAELRRRGLLAGHSDGARPAVTPHSDDRTQDYARRREISRWIWGEARDARGTPVERYLASRGITVPPPASLRWARSLRRPDGTYGPAMVARVDGIDGEVIGVHRTWLDRDDRGQWRRRDRAALGPIASGAVRLKLAAETLLVGEGIESVLAGIVATGLPGWAALSAAGIERLLLPSAVSNIAIAVDRDRSGVGERSARRAAGRWFGEGRQVRLIIPNRIGADANDLLCEASRAAW